MSIGLRGQTNPFGHLADQLSIQIDSELSQSNFQSTKYSLLAYSCGHLHTRFGKNLKRHRCMDDNFLSKMFFNLM
ncbi:hypothetical protein CICLE_v10013254mg [Citrus x clementina]|uniref:Uncharacterized protein n=1 Tax=Citrus clementina TaxID=85681 RepID=V4SMU9_CITCL|nr:hypothetical protein CICLE_v10013254mg [Citrus x clementina]